LARQTFLRSRAMEWCSCLFETWGNSSSFGEFGKNVCLEEICEWRFAKAGFKLQQHLKQDL